MFVFAMFGQTTYEVMVLDKTTIKVTDDGPYEVTGSFELIDADGHSFEMKKGVSLCRCGLSGEKPFCDGTHLEVDFESAPRANDLMVEV